jgi:purine nucleosidase
MAQVPQWIVDTDAGVDDAVALLTAMHRTGIEWAGLTSVSGNAPEDLVAKNLCYLLDWMDKDIPVYRGAVKPMFREPERSLDFMGADGLGGITSGLPALRHATTPGRAPMLLPELVKAARQKGEVVLTAIGPLTNLALAVRLAPDMVSYVDRLVIMGGSVHAQGNTSPVAEFNVFSDPEAAAIVFGAGFKQTWLVPWETCIKHFLPWAEYERICAQSSRNAKFFKQLTATTETFLRGKHRLPGIVLPDLMAIAVALDASIAIEAPEVFVEVDISKGVGHGLTAVDWTHSTGKQPNIRVVETLDARRAYSYLDEALRA